MMVGKVLVNIKIFMIDMVKCAEWCQILWVLNLFDGLSLLDNVTKKFWLIIARVLKDTE